MVNNKLNGISCNVQAAIIEICLENSPCSGRSSSIDGLETVKSNMTFGMNKFGKRKNSESKINSKFISCTFLNNLKKSIIVPELLNQSCEGEFLTDKEFSDIVVTKAKILTD